MDLHLKYRPAKLSEMVGNSSVIGALTTFTPAEIPHALLIVGPSGVGKTTLARILASRLPAKTTDVDGATLSGVDAMREIVSSAGYQLFGNLKRVIIVDECQALSKQAWQTLLKIIEEPPEYLYWCFCTTEPSKVPRTIETRCMKLTLKPIDVDSIIDLLERVIDGEDWETPADILRVCANQADGSARQAIQNLTLTAGSDSADEALELLTREPAGDYAIQLARLLAERRQDGAWRSVVEIVKKLEEAKEAPSPESIRLIIVNYAARAILGKSKEKPADLNRAQQFLNILEHFSKPFYENEKFAPLLLACARVLFPE